jgi:hypothetical protein
VLGAVSGRIAVQSRRDHQFRLDELHDLVPLRSQDVARPNFICKNKTTPRER